MARSSNSPNLCLCTINIWVVWICLIRWWSMWLLRELFTSSGKSVFFALLDRMAYCAYVLYIKNTSATRKLARIPFMCTLTKELCGQELDLGPHRPRVGTKPGVGHGLGHGVGHGLPVVNFPENKKSKTKQMYRIVRVHSTHTVYRQIQVYSFPRLSLLHSTLNLLFPFLFSQKPIRLQAIRLHESILRLRNVTSG